MRSCGQGGRAGQGGPGRAAALVAGVVVLAACGENTGLPPGATPSGTVTAHLMLNLPPASTAAPETTPAAGGPSVGGEPAPYSISRYPPVAAVSGPVRFVPCTVTRVKAGDSNLTPRTIPSAEPSPQIWEFRPYGGKLTVVHVMKLPLPGGRLGAGAAYDAAYPGPRKIAVADHDVTADVYFGVLDRGPGEMVAFVELRLSDEKPVSWTPERELNIVTDGGDGGFWSGEAGAGPENHDLDDYIDAFQAGVKAPRRNLCVTRRNEDQPRPTGFLFQTGVGDGRYPTYFGRDRHGEVVTVIHDGLLVPWALNGLPGTPPSDVAQAIADRRAGR